MEMIKKAHNELLKTPLLDWPLYALEEHLEYLRDLLSFDEIHLDSSHEHIIDDILKVESYIDYKKVK